MTRNSNRTENAGAKRKVGRPPVLDEAKRREICAILAVGCSRRTAAFYVDCSVNTIRRTALRNAEFAAQLRRAESACEVAALTHLNKAVKDGRNWRAAAWLLERRYPDRFGPRKPRSVSPDQLTDVVNRFAEVLSREISNADERQRILARLQNVTERLQSEEAAERSA